MIKNLIAPKISSNFSNSVKALCGVALLSYALPVFANDGDEFTYDGVNYTVISESEKTCSTKAGAYKDPGNPGYSGELKLHEKVINELNSQEYTLKEIGKYSFVECTGITGDLIIPNSVTKIGYQAFFSCTGLTGKLKIPDSVTEISDYAFASCSGLSGDLIIPDSVTILGMGAFSICRGFKGELKLPNSITRIEYRAFASCSGFTGELRIPDTVTYIGEDAFNNCSGFTGELRIPESVTRIIGSAFRYCSGFTGELRIPDSLTQIQEYTFNDCTGIETLIIGKSVKEIRSNAFTGTFGKNLNNIISLAENPPTIKSNSFNSTEPHIYVLSKSSYEKYLNAEFWKDFQGIDYLIEPNELTLTSLSLENNNNKSALKTTETLDFKCNVTSTVSTILNWPIEYKFKILWSAFPDNSVIFSDINESDNNEVVAIVANDALGEVKIKAEIEDYPEINYTYTINVSPLILGDADDDNAIDVADIITTANWIVGKKSDLFCFVNADSYKDFTIDVGDLTATTDIILGKTKTRSKEVQSSSITYDNEDSLSAIIYTDTSNSGIRIDVSLNGFGSYKALQAEIPIPEDITIENVERGEIASSHSLIYNIEEGLLKVVIFSADNRLFVPSEGGLFSITGRGTLQDASSLLIDNIVAIGDDSQKCNLSYKGATLDYTTGTDDLKNDPIRINSANGYLEIISPKELDFNIYNLNGVLVYSSRTSSSTTRVNLSNGFYIVNIDNKNIKTIIR